MGNRQKRPVWVGETAEEPLAVPGARWGFGGTPSCLHAKGAAALLGTEEGSVYLLTSEHTHCLLTVEHKVWDVFLMPPFALVHTMDRITRVHLESGDAEQLQIGPCSSCIVLPRHQHHALLSRNDGSIYAYNINALQPCLLEFPPLQVGQVVAMGIHPHKELLVVAYEEDVVLWNTAKGKVKASYNAKGIYSAVMGPGSCDILLLCDEGVFTWDGFTPQLLLPYVVAMVGTADAAVLCTESGELVQYTFTDKQVTILSSVDTAPYLVSFGDAILSASANAVSFLDREVDTNRPMQCIALFSIDDSSCALFSSPAAVYELLPRPQLLWELESNDAPSCAHSNTGMLAVGHTDGTLTVHSLESRCLVLSHCLHLSFITHVFVDDGIVTAIDADGIVSAMLLQTQHICLYEPLEDPCCLLLTDARLLVGLASGKLVIYDRKTLHKETVETQSSSILHLQQLTQTGHPTATIAPIDALPQDEVLLLVVSERNVLLFDAAFGLQSRITLDSTIVSARVVCVEDPSYALHLIDADSRLLQVRLMDLAVVTSTVLPCSSAMLQGSKGDVLLRCSGQWEYRCSGAPFVAQPLPADPPAAIPQLLEPRPHPAQRSKEQLQEQVARTALVVDKSDMLRDEADGFLEAAKLLRRKSQGQK